MNNKEQELHRIIDNVIHCCAVTVDDKGTLSITKEDLLGKSRAENLHMTRCILAAQLINAGYSVTTVAQILNRTVPAIRHMMKDDLIYIRSSRAYRIASAEATILNKDIELISI